jgi:hypothetical protein
MPNIEQGSASITLSEKNPFDLHFQDEDGNHSLAIVEPETFGQGTEKETQDLMRTMMAVHLLAPKMPEKIYTNFEFHFSELLYTLYEYYGKKKPRIFRVDEQVKPEIRGKSEDRNGFDLATSHSGGLDSVYRITKLLENGEVPLAVHLRNLNAKGNSREATASEEQCKSWEVPYLSVRLRNGSGSTGMDTMKTRDLLLALTVAIEAAPNKIKKVLIEGGMGTNPTDTHFSENENVWKWFNKLLKETGMDVEVVGVDPGDIETIGEIIELEKKLKISILPMVQNCFSAPHQVGNNRRRWEREAPSIAEHSSYYWCGSCHKCRRMTLGRFFYADPRFSSIPTKELNFFIKDTYDWMRKYPDNADLLSESFLSHLAALRKTD